MRINQFVASATGMSRRAADTAIQEGRVKISGRTATLGESVDHEEVVLDDQPLTLKTSHTYVILNKPAGYVTSRTRQGADPTIYELLPPELHDLRPVGRLDRDSSGLLLLTDDGDFIHRHTHPSFEKTKVYELTLQRAPSPSDRTQLEAGVVLDDGPSRVKVLDVQDRDITVALGEGRNRQLRRTFGALGHTVTRLHRTSMGEFELGDLAEGQWSKITPAAKK